MLRTAAGPMNFQILSNQHTPLGPMNLSPRNLTTMSDDLDHFALFDCPYRRHFLKYKPYMRDLCTRLNFTEYVRNTKPWNYRVLVLLSVCLVLFYFH